MAVKLRLKRMGRRHRSFFRLNAIDGRAPRDGRAIEELGWYDPLATELDKQAELKGERIAYWLSVGAVPSETVRSLLKKRGISAQGVAEQPAAASVAPAPEAQPAPEAAEASESEEGSEAPGESTEG